MYDCSGVRLLVPATALLPVNENMPRDRDDWNRGIRKLIGRFRSPAAALPAASVPVLQISDMGESTDSTSNSLATSQAVLRARTNLLHVLDEIDYEDSTSSGEV